MTPDPKTEALKPQIIGYIKQNNGIRGPGFAEWDEPVYADTSATERDAEAAAMRGALEQIAYGDIFDVTMRQIATAALTPTAGTDFAERLRKAVEERDEARAQLADAEKSSRDRFDQIMEARDQRDAAESDRDALAKALNPKRIADLLVTHKIVDGCAVYDPDGFDNHRTLDAINQFASALGAMGDGE